MSVCPSVTLLQIGSSFLFLDGIESFLAVISPCAPLQNFFFDFSFTPPNAQNLLPRICTKTPISRLVWQIDRRCLRLLGGFRGWPIQCNHAKCCGADPCCHGNEIRARRGDPVAYRLVCLFVCQCVYQHDKSRIDRDIVTKFLRHHSTLERADSSSGGRGPRRAYAPGGTFQGAAFQGI